MWLGRSRNTPSVDLSLEKCGSGARRVLRWGQPDAAGDHVGCTKPGVDIEQVAQALQEQSRAHEEHERQGELQDHETILQSASRPDGRPRGARDSGNERADFAFRATPARARSHAGEDRKGDGEQTNRRVDLDVLEAGECRDGQRAAVWRTLTKATSSPPTAPSTARRRASVISSLAMRGALAPRHDRRARSRIRAAVRASSRLATFAQPSHQHEADREQEDGHRRSQPPSMRSPSLTSTRAGSDPSDPVCLHARASERARYSSELGSGVSRRDARCQAAHRLGIQDLRSCGSMERSIQTCGRPDTSVPLGGLREIEPGKKIATTTVGTLSRRIDPRSHVDAEATLPQLVTEDHYVESLPGESSSGRKARP